MEILKTHAVDVLMESPAPLSAGRARRALVAGRARRTAADQQLRAGDRPVRAASRRYQRKVGHHRTQL
jgi:hypothetical protein